MKNKKCLSIIFILIVFLIIGDYLFNTDSFNYKRDFEEKYEFELKTADSGDWDSPITRSVGPNPYNVFIGDANHDGYNDIVTACAQASSVSILLWNITSGDWDTPITRTTDSGPFDVSLGDANNDGYDDIVTSNIGPFPEQTISILLWNTTSGDWDSQISRTVGGSPYGVFIGDANNDGYNDIVTSNQAGNTVSIVLWNITSSDWDSHITRSVESSPFAVFIGDANNDGYNDIAAANANSDTVSILLWNITSSNWDPQISKSTRFTPTDVFIGDANNDGYNDVVAPNKDQGTVSILLWNTTSGDWDPQINRQADNSPDSIFIRDANNDGYNDIVTANQFYNTVAILLWNSISNDWDSAIKRSVGDDSTGIFIGDANNDGYKDIVTSNIGVETVSILLWNVPPEIVINSPDQDDFIGIVAPDFDLSINESSLDTTWYIAEVEFGSDNPLDLEYYEFKRAEETPYIDDNIIGTLLGYDSTLITRFGRESEAAKLSRWLSNLRGSEASALKIWDRKVFQTDIARFKIALKKNFDFGETSAMYPFMKKHFENYIGRTSYYARFVYDYIFSIIDNFDIQVSSITQLSKKLNLPRLVDLGKYAKRKRLNPYFDLVAQTLKGIETGNLKPHDPSKVSDFKEYILESTFTFLKKVRLINYDVERKQFDALVYSLASFNLLGFKGGSTNNFLLSDMSRKYSGGAWTSNSLIKQQLKNGDHTRQFVFIMQDISSHKDKFPSFIEFANKKCYEYFVSIKGKKALRNVVGDLDHVISEAILFRALYRKHQADISDIETKMTRDQNPRRGDLVIRADPEVLKKINDLLGAGLTDNDFQRIKYIFIDITLSDNYGLLTRRKGRSPGKVWKNYQSPENLLLMVNNDPAKSHYDVDRFDNLLHEKMEKTELELSAKESRRVRIPNKEYIRFIHLKYIGDIFGLDSTFREEINTLTQHVNNALYSRTYSRSSSLDFLYDWFATEYRFLENLKDYYGIGGRVLSDLPF